MSERWFKFDCRICIAKKTNEKTTAIPLTKLPIAAKSENDMTVLPGQNCAHANAGEKLATVRLLERKRWHEEPRKRLFRTVDREEERFYRRALHARTHFCISALPRLRAPILPAPCFITWVVPVAGHDSFLFEVGGAASKNRVVFARPRHDLQRMKTQYHVFETALGFAGIAWSGAGITRFQLPSATADATSRGLLRRTPDAEEAVPPAHIAEAVAAVKRYFAGEKIDFSHLALDLEGQDELFRAIYAAARCVGYGETTTYGGLAKAIGRSDWEAARDVGQAMAKNPVALIIPCHRVLAAGGKIGGFSAPGGAGTKAKMLELEGVHIGSTQRELGL